MYKDTSCGNITFHERHQRLLRFMIVIIRWLPLVVRIKLLGSCRSMRGGRGIALRYALLKTVARECGEDVIILPDVYIKNPQSISFGSHISIHSMSYLDGGTNPNPDYGIIIGNHVSIAHGCTLIPSNHTFTNTITPIRDQPIDLGYIHICDNVWLGARVIVLNRVTVASGCVLGAGAVLTRDTVADGIYAGIPARKLRDRFGISKAYQV